MNTAYAESMAATRRPPGGREGRRSPAWSSPRPRRPSSPAATSTTSSRPRKEDAPEIAEMVRAGKAQLRRLETLGKPVVAAINGAALGGGLEIALATHHRIAVDDPKVQIGLPRGPARPAAGSGRRCSHRADARHRRSADAAVAAGPAPATRQGQGGRHPRRDRRRPGRADPRRQGLDQGAGRRGAGRAAVGRQGLQDPRWHAVESEARPEPARLPGEPAQAAEGRQLPGPAPHHVGGGRGRAGRLRHRDRDRGPLLRRLGHRAGRQEHDPGVLLRPAAGQRRPRPAGGHRAVPGAEGRRARRRNDGRSDRLRVRQSRNRGRAQGRLARGGRGR